MLPGMALLLDWKPRITIFWHAKAKRRLLMYWEVHGIPA